VKYFHGLDHLGKQPFAPLAQLAEQVTLNDGRSEVIRSELPNRLRKFRMNANACFNAGVDCPPGRVANQKPASSWKKYSLQTGQNVTSQQRFTQSNDGENEPVPSTEK
jgi:hypothetical protein